MKILFEDSSIIVIYKEAGLSVQSGKISDKDVVSELKLHLSQQKPELSLTTFTNRGPYLGIVHRLDRPVEGILVFGKTKQATSCLCGQIVKNEMEKIYHAVVCLDKDSYPTALIARKRNVTLTDYLRKDHSNNTSIVTSKDVFGAKRAELVFRAIDIKENRALIEIHLRTGRHHQIRVQFSHAGMPIEGDMKYGRDKKQREASTGEMSGLEVFRGEESTGGEYAGRASMGEMSGLEVFRGEESTGEESEREVSMKKQKNVMLAQEKQSDIRSGERNRESHDICSYKRKGLCLCASDLSFYHPVDKRIMRFHIKPSFLCQLRVC